MKTKYDSLLNNDIWTLTPLTPHRKHIGCNWVFKVKENPYHKVNKYKERLVAKRFHH